MPGYPGFGSEGSQVCGRGVMWTASKERGRTGSFKGDVEGTEDAIRTICAT